MAASSRTVDSSSSSSWNQHRSDHGTNTASSAVNLPPPAFVPIQTPGTQMNGDGSEVANPLLPSLPITQTGIPTVEQGENPLVPGGPHSPTGLSSLDSGANPVMAPVQVGIQTSGAETSSSVQGAIRDTSSGCNSFINCQFNNRAPVCIGEPAEKKARNVKK